MSNTSTTIKTRWKIPTTEQVATTYLRQRSQSSSKDMSRREIYKGWWLLDLKNTSLRRNLNRFTKCSPTTRQSRFSEYSPTTFWFTCGITTLNSCKMRLKILSLASSQRSKPNLNQSTTKADSSQKSSKSPRKTTKKRKLIYRCRIKR